MRNPLLGLACGDRIGGPIRMALLVAESLATVRGFSEADLAARYLAWFRADAFDSGPTWSAVFSLYDQGVPLPEAARRVDRDAGGMTAGINPAHRVAAVGCARWLSLDEVARIARAEARLTHAHPDAAEASAATALLVRWLLDGQAWDEARALAAAWTRGPVALALRDDPPLSRLGRGGHAPETLAAALWFVTHAHSFAEALERSIHFAGPANYCPVLVGAWAAARWGVGDERPALAAAAERGFTRLSVA